jgi:hypothetical protein
VDNLEKQTSIVPVFVLFFVNQSSVITAMSTPETWKKIEQSKQRRLQQPLQASDTDHHRLSSTANYYNGQQQIDFTDDRAFGRQYTSFEAAKKHRQQLPNDVNVRVQHKLCSIVEVCLTNQLMNLNIYLGKRDIIRCAMLRVDCMR